VGGKHFSDLFITLGERIRLGSEHLKHSVLCEWIFDSARGSGCGYG
jgi:hypothetical protein